MPVELPKPTMRPPWVVAVLNHASVENRVGLAWACASNTCARVVNRIDGSARSWMAPSSPRTALPDNVPDLPRRPESATAEPEVSAKRQKSSGSADATAAP